MSPTMKAALIGFSIAAMLAGGVARAGDLYTEIGVGHNMSLFHETDENRWDNGGSPGFYGAVRYETPLDIDKRAVFVLQYMHVSNWFAGPPFNDSAESSLDHFGVALRWRWNK